MARKNGARRDFTRRIKKTAPESAEKEDSPEDIVIDLTETEETEMENEDK
ncbi:hypothetical protein ANG5_0403, partial [Streptococcus constellatus subsp. pharyngis SK1060 = CCUG 46377]